MSSQVSTNREKRISELPRLATADY